MPFNKAVQTGLTIASILIFLFLCWYFQTIVIYILSAAVISIIGRPLIKSLSKIKVGRFHLPPSVCSLLTLLCFYIIIIALIAIFVPIISEEVRKISSIDYIEIAESLQEPILGVEHFLKKYYLIDADKSLKETVIEYGNEFIQAIKFGTVANSILNVLGNTVLGIVSITFVAFFFLKDPKLFKNIIYTLTPSRYEMQMKNILNQSKELLTRYFIGVIIQISVVAFLLTIGLTIIGMGETNITFKLALMIATFASFFNIIPYVGPLIGAVFGILICISSNLDLPFYSGIAPMIFKVTAVFIAVQIIDNFILQPYIFSTSVKAHPLEIFIVILVSASFAGVTGMIIAIPSYTVLRIVAREFFSQFKIVRNLTARI